MWDVGRGTWDVGCAAVDVAVEMAASAENSARRGAKSPRPQQCGGSRPHLSGD